MRNQSRAQRELALKISSLSFNKPYGDAMKLLAPQQVKLGFIGLGNMGSRIARRLLARGYEVTVSDRDNTKPEALLVNGPVPPSPIVELARTAAEIRSCLTSNEA